MASTQIPLRLAIRQSFSMIRRSFVNQGEVCAREQNDSSSLSEESKEKLLVPLRQLEQLDLTTFRPLPPPGGGVDSYFEYSPSMQHIVQLGVSLYSLVKRRRDVAEFIARCSFKRDIQPIICYLTNDLGMSNEQCSRVLQVNPAIFMDGENGKLLQMSRYLLDVGFTKEDICSIFNTTPSLGTAEAKDVDKTLQHLQAFFYFTGTELRDIAVRQSAILTIPYPRVRFLEGFFRRSLLFTRSQVHSCIMAAPALLTQNVDRTSYNFILLHNEHKVELDNILAAPHVLTAVPINLSHRMEFLVRSGKAQFDPTKPLYTSPLIMIADSDEAFLSGIPGPSVSIELYRNFIRSQ